MPKPINPTELLKQVMSERGWNQTTFAKHLGVSGSNLSMVLNGERALPPAMILKLGSITNISSDVWAKRASEYKEWLLSDEARRELVGEQSENPENDSHRVYGLMVDHEIVRACEVGLIKIEPFAEASLQPASYDCRVGAIVRLDGSTMTSKDSSVTIAVGETAWVRTLERVTLCDSVVGRVGIPTPLVMDGIFVSFGLQIDPGYSGELIAAVRNQGTDAFEFKLAKTIIFSLEFHGLRSTPRRKFSELRSAPNIPIINERNN